MCHADLMCNKPYYQYFICTFYGSICITVLYSFCLTAGKTSSWLFVTILALLAFQKKYEHCPKSLSNNATNKKYQWMIVIGVMTVFWLSSIIFIDFQTMSFFPIDGDLIFYSKVTDVLNQGVESKVLSDSHNMTPYHYYELWLAALVIQVTKLGGYGVFSLVITPFLGTLVFLGLAAACEAKNLATPWMLFLCIFLVFPENILNNSFVARHAFRLSYSIYPFMKWMLAAAVILLFWINSKYYSLTYALISLLILSAMYVLCMPGILGGVFLFSLYKLLTEKSTEYKRLFLMILFFGLVYFVYMLCSLNPSMTNGKITFTALAAYIPHVIGRLIKIFVVILFCCWPMGIFIYYSKNLKLTKSYILLSLLCILCATAATCLVAHIPDSLQTQTIILSGLLGVMIVMQFICCIATKCHRILLLACIILAFFGPVKLLARLFRNYDAVDVAYVQKVIETISAEQNSTNKVNVAVLKNQDIPTIYHWGLQFYPGQEINAYIPNMCVYSLSELDILQANFYIYEKNTARKSYYNDVISEGHFYQYCQSTDPSLPLWEKQITFMKNRKIRYLFADKDAKINDNLLNKLILICVNRLTGEQFYRFMDDLEPSPSSAKKAKQSESSQHTHTPEKFTAMIKQSQPPTTRFQRTPHPLHFPQEHSD